MNFPSRKRLLYSLEILSLFIRTEAPDFIQISFSTVEKTILFTLVRSFVGFFVWIYTFYVPYRWLTFEVNGRSRVSLDFNVSIITFYLFFYLILRDHSRKPGHRHITNTKSYLRIYIYIYILPPYIII